MREWLTKEEFDDQQERLGYPVKRKWLSREEYEAQQASRRVRKPRKPKKKKSKKRKGSPRRMSDSKRNFQERACWQNRHHIVNKCRGGNASTANILMMDERRHSAFHLLFRNMDFLQVANLLIRCHCMKTSTERFYAKAIIVQREIEEDFDGVGCG